MDPNKALKNLREAEKQYRAAPAGSMAERVAASNMADAFEALDEWLSRGGFMPVDWRVVKPLRK